MKTATRSFDVSAERRRPRVLMYHALGSRSGEADPDNLFVPVARFERQLEEIERRGLRPVGLSAYLAADRPRDAVLLTFDDAYASTLELAAPRLAARGWPAVVYVASHTVGRAAHWNFHPDEHLLDVLGLKAIVEHGFEIGAHSRTHGDLRGLSAAELRAEVVGCADDLEAMLGVRPRSFAYPYGHHDAASRAQVEAAGYSCGFAVHHAKGPFARSRVDVNAHDNDRVFSLKLHPAWPVAYRVSGIVPLARRAAHRAAGIAKR